MALDPDTLDQLLDTVRRYVRERLVPLEAEVAENDAVPPEVIAEMRDLGLFGLSIPEEHGGLGLSVSDEVRVVHLEDVRVVQEDCLVRCRQRPLLRCRHWDQVHGGGLRGHLRAGDGLLRFLPS